MGDKLGCEVLFAGITASELDAAVELGLLGWAHVTRFAVERLLDGWDTPSLRELAGEPTDVRRVDERRVAPRWHRTLDELELPRAAPLSRAVEVHAGHILRLWREERIDLHEAIEVVSGLRPPMMPLSRIEPAIWIVDILSSELTFAHDWPREEHIPGLRRAATLALHRLGTIL
jgi:hypothetical protein